MYLIIIHLLIVSNDYFAEALVEKSHRLLRTKWHFSGGIKAAWLGG